MGNGRTLLADLESDGFLKQMTRIHSLVLRDAVTQETFVFRKRDADPALEMYPLSRPGELFAVEAEDNIAEGVVMLQEAAMIIFHNGIAFDIPAIRKIYPDFQPQGIVRDTLVLARVIKPDTSDIDFPLNAQGILPGKLIKKHSLDAWGYRLGIKKGDYAEQMEVLGKNPWAAWNMDMENYCVQDVDVTEVLWAACLADMPPDACVTDEHDIHTLCTYVEKLGFPFDEVGALKLKAVLQSEYDRLATEIKDKFGPWYAPVKRVHLLPEWDDPEGYNKAKFEEDMYCLANGTKPTKRQKYHKPRAEFGETLARTWVAEVFVPKKTMRVRSSVPPELSHPDATHSLRMQGEINPETGFMDGAYCKIERRDFNPGSRDQVIDRFTQLFDWKPNPHEFTENGTPEINDEVLRTLADPEKMPADKLIPIAAPIAECFFIKKYLGQIYDGKESWLKKVDPDTGAIHCYINTGGTVSGRCSHIGPNLGQVPATQEKAVKNKDGSWNPLLTNNGGEPLDICFDWDGNLKEEAPLPGRKGDYGFECRSLFGVPEGWVQVGVDLSGIEFRCLAELTLPFDDGELIDVIVSGQDIHAFNMKKTGIDNRNTIKRCLYGLMYGAGDYKLGITADPMLTSDEVAAKRLGRRIRDQLMAGLPALKKAIDKVQAEAASGFLIGLDGRKLLCRNEYSALNLRLQSNAALIAKKWLVLTERNALARGWDHGWLSSNTIDGRGDFAMMAFVHDEQQSAVRPELREEFGAIACEAAAQAGKHFKFVCPVGAKAKYGFNWAQCH